MQRNLIMKGDWYLLHWQISLSDRTHTTAGSNVTTCSCSTHTHKDIEWAVSRHRRVKWISLASSPGWCSCKCRSLHASIGGRVFLKLILVQQLTLLSSVAVVFWSNGITGRRWQVWWQCLWSERRQRSDKGAGANKYPCLLQSHFTPGWMPAVAFSIADHCSSQYVFDHECKRSTNRLFDMRLCVVVIYNRCVTCSSLRSAVFQFMEAVSST